MMIITFVTITINSNGVSKRIEDYQISSKNLEQKIFNEFNELKFHEQDILNFIQSGEEWYGRSLM